MVRKTVNMLFGVIGFGFAFYMLYQAFTVHEGLLPMVLRIIASFIWLTLGIYCLKERDHTSEDYTRKWFYKKRRLGKSYYITRYAILWSLFIGFMSWMPSAEFHKGNLPEDTFIRLGIYAFFGVLLGYQGWNRYEKEAMELGLYENENIEKTILQKKV